ncbi:MAG: hypothetical protein WCO69_06200 [Candidatus Omnitrophota bacterium]
MNKTPATSNASTICLWLTFAIGIFFLYPSIDTYNFLATGDHGRDFYAFERTLHGDVPYQDYWWVYGPIMPYYYAVADFVLGVNMVSILSAKALLTLVSGLFIFLTLETLSGGFCALAGAAWFFAFGRDFFFTFNHAGGIACIAVLMYCVARYIATRHDDWLWTGLVTAFILAMVKVNFGIVAIPVVLLTAFLADRSYDVPFTPKKKFFYLFGGLILPLIIAMVYALFLRGLTWLEIRQCMPYSNADQPMNTLPWLALGDYLTFLKTRFLKLGVDYAFGMLVICSIIASLQVLRSNKLETSQQKAYGLTLVIFGIYIVLNFHEFLKSGVMYRSIWAQPVMIVWMFTVIALGLSQFGRPTRIIIMLLPLTLAAGQMRLLYNETARLHNTDHYLTHPRAKVFIRNDSDWITTVEDTAKFIDENIPKNETFLALPYDPIYYYLTGRASPSRMLIFFNHINISPEQERQVIREINAARVNYIVISSRIHSQEPGNGSFGDTYCPTLARYITDRFDPVAKFGNWTDESFWAAHHGTMVMKRKDILR